MEETRRDLPERTFDFARQVSQSRTDFIAKYSIACKESRETNCWLRMLAVSEIVTDLNFKDMINESDQLIAIPTAIIKTARKNA